jgi:hypothetical protein
MVYFVTGPEILGSDPAARANREMNRIVLEAMKNTKDSLMFLIDPKTPDLVLKLLREQLPKAGFTNVSRRKIERDEYLCVEGNPYARENRLKAALERIEMAIATEQPTDHLLVADVQVPEELKKTVTDIYISAGWKQVLFISEHGKSGKVGLVFEQKP